MKSVLVDKESIINNEKFKEYYEFLVSENKKYNLTTILEEEEVYNRHFINSATASEIIEKSSKVLDIGAGAGFPGVVLKILKGDDIELVCVDSVRKKVEFLTKLSEKVDVRYEAIHSRAEDLVEVEGFNEGFDYVVSRAVANLSTMLEYSAPFLKIGGKVICYKGENFKSEIESAENAISVLNLKLEQMFEYKEQGTYLLVFGKIASCPKGYPRRGNKPRLKPL